MATKSTRDALKGFGGVVRQMMEHWKVPGCAIGIVKDGEVVLAQGYGLRNVKKKLPVTTETLFAIGSCTKAFVTMAMGMLVDEGKLAWDTPVREYLPEFRLSDAVVTERITPRDLVTHRSGLPRHDLLWYGSPFSRQEIFSRLRHLDLSKDLRQEFQYNNLMYAAAGVLIERVSGNTWEEFTRRRIFSPLGMTHSNLSVTDSQKRKDHSRPYQKERDTDIVKELPFRNLDNAGPAGSINSCVTDMVKWLALHLGAGEAGGKSLISKSNLKQMHSPQIAVSGPSEMDPEFGLSAYGLGWGIGSWRGHHFVQHGGGIDGFLTLTTLFPADGIGMFVINNLVASPLNEVLTFNVADRLLGLAPVPLAERWIKREAEAKAAEKKGKQEADAGRKPGTQPSHDLQAYVGDYEHPGYGRATISQEKEQLIFTFNHMRIPLRHYHYDVFDGNFEETNYKLVFSADVNGLISGLSAPFEPAVKPAIFAKVAPKLAPEMLQKCVGEYDGGMAVHISLHGEDQLALAMPNAPVFTLISIEGLRFKVKELEGYTLEFKQAQDGSVAEILVQIPSGPAIWRRK